MRWAMRATSEPRRPIYVMIELTWSDWTNSCRTLRRVTFTPPNDNVRRANASTEYDPTAFSSGGDLVQVGYTNFVSTWATWLEKGLQAVGLSRTLEFSSGGLMGYHYSQSTIRASDQTRSSSASYVYNAKAGSTGNRLKVYTQTMVKKIVFDSNNKATGTSCNTIVLSNHLD